MIAVRVHGFGDAGVLICEEVPLPQPDGDQVRVKIEAAGVNFVDIYERKGLYPLSLPATAGKEGAGTVDAVGPNVEKLRVGDRVAFAMSRGSYAEYALVPTEQAVPLPAEAGLRTGAAAMLQGLTAHYLCTSTFALSSGHTALIHAAAGGVGRLLVQMAHRRGARVIATVSTAEKAELARQAGADEVILYTRENFETRTSELTGGSGVNVVYDSVGQATFEKSLRCLEPRGYLVLYGEASGPVAAFDPQILNKLGSLFLTRPTLGHYVATREELLRRSRELFDWIQSGELEVRIDETFALEEAADAHRYMEARKTRGKILLLP